MSIRASLTAPQLSTCLSLCGANNVGCSERCGRSTSLCRSARDSRAPSRPARDCLRRTTFVFRDARASRAFSRVSRGVYPLACPACAQGINAEHVKVPLTKAGRDHVMLHPIDAYPLAHKNYLAHTSAPSMGASSTWFGVEHCLELSFRDTLAVTPRRGFPSRLGTISRHVLVRTKRRTPGPALVSKTGVVACVFQESCALLRMRCRAVDLAEHTGICTRTSSVELL